jgi:purine-binding chemotaxis protein CheW
MTRSEDLGFFDAFDAARPAAASACDAVSCVQFLVFAVAGMEIAVALEHVTEIIPYERVSALPGTPEYVRGVAQLRGQVLPLVDLAIKLGRAPAPISKRTCILVLELEFAGARWAIGMLTDGVPALRDVRSEELQPPPHFGQDVDVRYIESLLPDERGMRAAIDLPRVFASAELQAVAQAASRPAS